MSSNRPPHYGTCFLWKMLFIQHIWQHILSTCYVPGTMINCNEFICFTCMMLFKFSTTTQGRWSHCPHFQRGEREKKKWGPGKWNSCLSSDSGKWALNQAHISKQPSSSVHSVFPCRTQTDSLTLCTAAQRGASRPASILPVRTSRGRRRSSAPLWRPMSCHPWFPLRTGFPQGLKDILWKIGLGLSKFRKDCVQSSSRRFTFLAY